MGTSVRLDHVDQIEGYQCMLILTNSLACVAYRYGTTAHSPQNNGQDTCQTSIRVPVGLRGDRCSFGHLKPPV